MLLPFCLTFFYRGTGVPFPVFSMMIVRRFRCASVTALSVIMIVLSVLMVRMSVGMLSSLHLPGRDETLIPESDQICASGAKEGLLHQVVIGRVAVLDQ